MMEASRLPPVQATENQNKQPSSPQSEPLAEDSDGFEQQLSSQLSQNDSLENVENNNKKQMVTEEFPKDVETVFGWLEAPEMTAMTDSGLIDDPDLPAAEQILPLAIMSQSTEQSPGRVLQVLKPEQQALPSTGKVLPPVDQQLQFKLAQLQTADANRTQRVDMVSKSVEALAQSMPAQVQPVRHGFSQEPAQNLLASQIGMDQALEQLPVDMLLNKKQLAMNQKAQSRLDLVMASSVAITASQLQKTPSTTALAHLNLPTASLGFDAPINGNLNNALSPGISTPVHSQAWSQGLSEQVAWLVRGNIQSAEIRLNPAHLGPLEVKLSIKDDVASLSFISNHAQVREALDLAMPRLRDMLEQQGINLADVDVSQYSEHERQSADEAGDNNRSVSAKAEHESSNQGETVEDIKLTSVDAGLSIYA